jgi:hypothetical protein
MARKNADQAAVRVCCPASPGRRMCARARNYPSFAAAHGRGLGSSLFGWKTFRSCSGWIQVVKASAGCARCRSGHVAALIGHANRLG